MTSHSFPNRTVALVLLVKALTLRLPHSIMMLIGPYSSSRSLDSPAAVALLLAAFPLALAVGLAAWWACNPLARYTAGQQTGSRAGFSEAGATLLTIALSALGLYLLASALAETPTSGFRILTRIIAADAVPEMSRVDIPNPGIYAIGRVFRHLLRIVLGAMLLFQARRMSTAVAGWNRKKPASGQSPKGDQIAESVGHDGGQAEGEET